ncbi:hypothetical protein FRC08_003268 [Ceratobasidium sp. 394]|nr:hypothetical protein FRC08_003268 [Ceratobasidium sp. 394]
MPNLRLFQSLPELGRNTPGRVLDVLARHSQVDDPEQMSVAPSQNEGRALDEVLCLLLDTLTLRGCERIKRGSVEGPVERRAGSLRKVRMFGCEGIGLKGELRRTGTWMPPVRGGSTKSGKSGGIILKKVDLVRRDTAAGFVVVDRNVRRAGKVTG